MIKDSLFDSKDAVVEFHKALDAYCTSLNCKKPVADKPKPSAATIVEARTNVYGGSGGAAFEFSHPSTTMDAVKFVIWHESYINSIQMDLGDGVETKSSPT